MRPKLATLRSDVASMEKQYFTGKRNAVGNKSRSTVANSVLVLRRPQYTEALVLFPLLAAGYLVLIAGGPGHARLWLASRTRVVLRIDLAGAGLAILAEAILIRPFAGTGAALGLLVGAAYTAVAKNSAAGTLREIPFSWLISLGQERSAAASTIRQLIRRA